MIKLTKIKPNNLFLTAVCGTLLPLFCLNQVLYDEPVVKGEDNNWVCLEKLTLFTLLLFMCILAEYDATFQPPAASIWPNVSGSAYEGGEYKLILAKTGKYNKQIRCERACGASNIVTHSYVGV